ncbi:hypothetical protein SSS_03136 [Sarcoptes scabiei]|uniref:Uncharacterized protein n=1 Tax=Sarcoptes scabiei TaxID=52283 RepID=A0A834VFW9_SARSC|nr:hypothetical protein SSS_03136 [Sarcoptes scabiei]
MNFDNLRLYFLLIIGFVLVFDSVNAQKKRRNRTKNKGADQCHQKELIKCLDKLTALGKEESPSSIITTSQGLNQICRVIKDDTIKCAKGYFKKCGTPLHREISDLIIDVLMHHVSGFCDNSQQKSKFLKHSNCFHSKVFESSEFKTKCNNPFLNLVGKIDLNQYHADDLHESICCGYNTWYDCTGNLVKRDCSMDGFRMYKEFHNSTVGPITDLFCPFDVFPPSSSVCRTLHNNAKPKGNGKAPENTISKLIVQYVPFLFARN